MLISNMPTYFKTLIATDLKLAKIDLYSVHILYMYVHKLQLHRETNL
jgi:hypothetical protein